MEGKYEYALYKLLALITTQVDTDVDFAFRDVELNLLIEEAYHLLDVIQNDDDYQIGGVG